MKKTVIPRGAEHFVFVDRKAKGCLYGGLYQFEGTIFWKIKAVVFGVPEWGKVDTEELQRLEMVKGDELLRAIDADVARDKGYLVMTPNGERWAIPLDAWEEVEFAK